MEDVNKYKAFRGNSQRLGVWKRREGCQFAVSAPEAAKVELLLYPKGKTEVCREIPFDKDPWAGSVRTLFLQGFSGKNYEYNYRIDGKVVHDPYARAVCGREVFGSDWTKEEHGVRCGFLEDDFWSSVTDTAPGLSYEEMILYKLHVRGYTMNKNSRVRKKGTFLGLEEKISYWKELGINAIELMPAYEFEEMILPKEDPDLRTYHIQTGNRLNFWGYTGGFYYAPKAAYCAGNSPQREFCHLIHALHTAGIECIMEFFFAEDVSPVEILDVLHHWKAQYHVDGFHLIGSRLPQELIAKDAFLKDTKLFFLHPAQEALLSKEKRLAEYNGGFSQDMRRWLKGDEGMLAAAASRIRQNPSDCGVINYLTTQDGFTLADLVSYDWKHNADNGEDNRDGSEYNYSWNCGVEGPSRKLSIRQLRKKQMRNAFLLLLFSQGTPLLYGGDEIANSQEGNNNAYCQDNPLGWIDWSGLKKQEDLLSFVKAAIAFRKAHPVLHMRKGTRGSDYLSVGCPDISLHSQRAWYAGMEHTARNLGVMYCCAYEPLETEIKFLYLAYNFHWEPKEFALPNLPEKARWVRIADTSDFGCSGIYAAGEEIEQENQRILTVPARTVMVLAGK